MRVNLAAGARDVTAGASGGRYGDPGCQAIASQISGISSQISATPGDYSAQVPVLNEWYNDLQNDQQESQNGVIAGAIGDTAADLENVIVELPSPVPGRHRLPGTGIQSARAQDQPRERKRSAPS
jgi:hypothetical protein